MKKVLKWLGGGLAVLVILAGLLFVNVWYFKPVSIDLFYGRVFLKVALDSPELLTSLRLLDGIGIRGHNARLSDASPQAELESLQTFANEYEVFQRYDRDDYSDEALLSYDVFDYFMSQYVVDGERFLYHSFPVNQMFGIQSSLPNFMVDQHVIEDQTGAEHYLARLQQFDEVFAQVVEGLRLREQRGILPPQFAVQKVLKQMREFIDKPASEHLLATHFAERMDALSDQLDAGEREQLSAAVNAAVADSIYPAYRKLIAYLESIESKATSNDGVWRLPDGDEYYANQVAFHTSTDMTPEQIHEIGLQEVARIATEMDAILIAEGLTEGTIGERVQQLAKRPDQLYPDSEAGREQILADYQTILDEIDAGMNAAFNLRPDTGVEVRRVPEFSQDTAPGAYYQGPSLDGERPGVFFANLRNVGEIPKFGMRTLAYHEGIPGHHFQIALTQELKDLPMFRRLIPMTVFSEGWALYAEQLAFEMGYQDDPLDNLGRLQAEMFRAVRLVVDTGMHHKRWSREASIQYMLDYTGMGVDEVTAEIERYLVNPGQALAYKIGMMKILELREYARAALGERFDLKAFHDQVLTHGALPMYLLERVVRDWVDSMQDNATA
ncbi:MAG: DUF885 domain-containing protein [Gammaproteobacteria bacterium]|nr:DUF885 domain-containing protein [Gammaproteobacteria bacterium]